MLNVSDCQISTKQFYVYFNIFSQRGRVASLVGSVGVVGACSAHHHHDGGELFAAVLAGVGSLLGAFVELVASAVGTVGVARACGRRKLLH